VWIAGKCLEALAGPRTEIDFGDALARLGGEAEAIGNGPSRLDGPLERARSDARHVLIGETLRESARLRLADIAQRHPGRSAA